MGSQHTVVDWDSFLGRSTQNLNLSEFQDLHENKCVLVTGAGGSIGSALARALAPMRPRVLVLLDAAESNLFHVEAELSSLGSSSHVAALGSITDEQLVSELFERFRPELIYHAAAYKHVPLLESNPLAAIHNNVFGTLAIARGARAYGARSFVLISTDKAVYPHSIMGASKRMAELALLAHEDRDMQAAVVRLGNVLGSDGSVANIFLQQIAAGAPVTVTHAESRRYFLSMVETVQNIFAAVEEHARGIFVPEMGEPLPIRQLAAHLIARFAKRDVPIVYSGLRPGDKLIEDLAYDYEVLESHAGNLRRYAGEISSPEKVLAGLGALQTSVSERNLSRILELVCAMVPEYKPSDALLHRVSESVVA